MNFKQFTEATPLKFELVDGKYQWTGAVNPSNVHIKVRKSKWSAVASAAAQYASERLFADRPINIEILWDNLIGSSVGAFGASSTSEDGNHTQVYISPKRAGEHGASAIASTVIEELVHAWQRRSGWGRPDATIEYHDRPEEIHAKDVTQLLSNEFALKHGAQYGIESSPWMNTPKYFDVMIKRLGAQLQPGVYVRKLTYDL